jgi:5'-phosphate synthase pdxT subunit
VNHAADRFGVLALQGDFARHGSVIEALGADWCEVRTADELSQTAGLVIPGGESTTISMGIEREALAGPLLEYAKSGRPIFGTCAGMVLLGQGHLGLIDIDVERNAYGRQVHSFETDVEVSCIEGDPVRALFIRAPIATRVGDGVEVLAHLEGAPVFVRQDNVSAISFHPELVGEHRIHAYALGLGVGSKQSD